MRREHIAAAFGGFGHERLESRHFGFRGSEVGEVGRIFLGRQIAARLPGAIDRVAEALRESVYRLLGAVEVQPKAPFVERALSGTARTVQFLT